jgi:hypothetical protein
MKKSYKYMYLTTHFQSDYTTLLSWLRHWVYPALHGAQVLDLLDGTNAAPAKTLGVDDAGKKKQIMNPDYVTWVSRDSAVLGWLLNSLSPKVLAHTIGVESTASVCNIITTMFSRSRSKINQLRGVLSGTKKN